MSWTAERAVAYVNHHVEVWNKHNLDEIMKLYATNAELTSPFADQVVGSSLVRGHDQLQEYFGTALQRNPDLQFEVVDILLSVNSVTIYMRSLQGRMVAEVLFFDNDGLVDKVFAHYSCSASG